MEHEATRSLDARSACSVRNAPCGGSTASAERPPVPVRRDGARGWEGTQRGDRQNGWGTAAVQGTALQPALRAEAVPLPPGVSGLPRLCPAPGSSTRCWWLYFQGLNSLQMHSFLCTLFIVFLTHLLVFLWKQEVLFLTGNTVIVVLISLPVSPTASQTGI